ncbi:MAG: hypothetical protein IKN57_09615, partial [Parasporobacterium sp.]|nr:hypothetical protein [Parasporobacterium sp.]
MNRKLRIIAPFIAFMLLVQIIPSSVRAENTSPVIKGTFQFLQVGGSEPLTETYFYSDDYFTGSSLDDNTHRTTMSMALALSTFEEHNDSYVTALLNETGFEDIRTEDMNIRPTRETIGTAIARKKINGTDLVAVAVRGANYASEWASNLTVGPDGNCLGLSEASEKVAARIKSYIKEHELENVKLWITGYSRAGAVAGLTGVLINEQPDAFSTTEENIYVYTFEAPKASASPVIYDNIRCIRNRNDIITYIYPYEWGIYSNGVDILTGEPVEIKICTLDPISFIRS